MCTKLLYAMLVLLKVCPCPLSPCIFFQFLPGARAQRSARLLIELICRLAFFQLISIVKKMKTLRVPEEIFSPTKWNSWVTSASWMNSQLHGLHSVLRVLLATITLSIFTPKTSGRFNTSIG